MKTKMKIFTVLLMTLIAMPGFVQAANPSALDQLNALGPDLTKKAEETSKKIIEKQNTSETRSKSTQETDTKKQGSKGTALKRKGMACTNAKEHQLLATYESDGGPCVVKSCVVGYKLENGACVKKAKKGETETGETDGTTPETETEGSEEERQKALEEKQKAYDEAKANEQSTANKTLTAATTAAMGIGAMELLQGRAEQKADKQAEESMAAYIATMRCTYGEDKQVKAGPDEIELPGGNNQDLMKYRSEYLALATDLKERKTALGMKPGIESEELIDKASTGLYDDENLGITSGAYASLYRAQMLGSETDQAKIDEAAKTSKNRVLGGAIAAGAGLVIGVAGNSLINGKLGELIKSKKDKKQEEKTELTEEKAKKIIPVEESIGNISKSSITNFQDFIYIKAFGFDNLCYYEDDNNELKGAEDLTLCKELKKGEWLAKFDYGIVKGNASCNDTKGNTYCDYYSYEQSSNSACAQETIDRTSFEKPSSTFNTDSTGQYCWCQTTNIGKASSNWVFESESDDKETCAKECARRCAFYFGDGDNTEFTKEILSSTKD